MRAAPRIISMDRHRIEVAHRIKRGEVISALSKEAEFGQLRNKRGTVESEGRSRRPQVTHTAMKERNSGVPHQRGRGLYGWQSGER